MVASVTCVNMNVWRKAEAAKMIAAMQGFKDLFEGDNPAKKLIRGIGMSLVGQLPGAKQEIMSRAWE